MSSSLPFYGSPQSTDILPLGMFPGQRSLEIVKLIKAIIVPLGPFHVDMLWKTPRIGVGNDFRGSRTDHQVQILVPPYSCCVTLVDNSPYVLPFPPLWKGMTASPTLQVLRCVSIR